MVQPVTILGTGLSDASFFSPRPKTAGSHKQASPRHTGQIMYIPTSTIILLSFSGYCPFRRLIRSDLHFSTSLFELECATAKVLRRRHTTGSFRRRYRSADHDCRQIAHKHKLHEQRTPEALSVELEALNF